MHCANIGPCVRSPQSDRLDTGQTAITFHCMEGGPGGFPFNQYLIVGDEPLLFHTGPRKMFPLVREAVASVMPVERLRYIAFSHVEADECGSLNVSDELCL